MFFFVMAIAIAIKIAVAVQIAIAILIAIAITQNEKWQPTAKQFKFSIFNFFHLVSHAKFEN